MPIRPVRVVATLLVVAAGLAAGEADDVTLSYSYEETAGGRDIKEGIYGTHGAGEFDEWRLVFGLAPGIDRIQLKTKIDGQPYPGPSMVETDRLMNDPALAPQLGLVWVLGDYEGGDHGWFTTLGLDWTRRYYRIFYGLGAESPSLRFDAVTAHLGMGYGGYLTSRLRVELEPFVNGGIMWTQLDLIDMSIPAPALKVSGGPVIEGGLRGALIWHPGNTQAWHLGASVDYRTGYAQTIYHNEATIAGIPSQIDSEVRMWWYGFGYSFFYGHKF